MRRMLFALMLGLAAGYWLGYRDADQSRGTVLDQAMEKFGASKIKDAQAARERRAEEAATP